MTVPEPETRATNTRFGYLCIQDEDDLISTSLEIYGEWAQNEITVLLAFIKTGDTVIDLGSALGTEWQA